MVLATLYGDCSDGNGLMPGWVNSLTERVYFRGLVFNQSWEDPEMDREALAIEADRDRVLSITSGGCNCLNLLCLSPRQLTCIDGNPVQSHMLDLKLAGIRALDFDEFFAFFAAREPGRSRAVYYSALQSALPPLARGFWDEHIGLYQRGIFGQGKLGLFMRLLRVYLRVQIGERELRQFLAIERLDEQRAYYFDRIRPRLWRSPLIPILSSRLMLNLAGMHPQQYDLIARDYGIRRYAEDRVDALLAETPVHSNYFLAQALLGEYLDAEQVPPYLRRENFATLKRNVDRVTNLTGWLTGYLDSQAESSIDKLSLLDIFDWMDRDQFRGALRTVLRAGADGGRFVYRSTIPALPVPVELEPSVVAEQELAERLLKGDRSGVYSSFYVYRIRKQGERPVEAVAPGARAQPARLAD